MVDKNIMHNMSFGELFESIGGVAEGKLPTDYGDEAKVIKDLTEDRDTEQEDGIPQFVLDIARELYGTGMSMRELVDNVLDDAEARDWFNNKYDGNEFDLSHDLEDSFEDVEDDDFVEEAKKNKDKKKKMPNKKTSCAKESKKKTTDASRSVDEKHTIYSLEDVERLVRNKLAPVRSTLETAETDEEYVALLRRFSGSLGVSADALDGLAFKSADYLHYHQTLDSDVAEFLASLDNSVGEARKQRGEKTGCAKEAKKKTFEKNWKYELNIDLLEEDMDDTDDVPDKLKNKAANDIRAFAEQNFGGKSGRELEIYQDLESVASEFEDAVSVADFDGAMNTLYDIADNTDIWVIAHWLDSIDDIKEGKLPTDYGDEAKVIKDLTEADDAEEDDIDELELPVEDDITPDESPEDDEEVKMYFAKQDDTFYYLVTNESGSVYKIVDQNENDVFTSKDGDFTDIVEFIVAALRELTVDEMSVDIFNNYILPKITEEEEPEEEEEAVEEAPTEVEDEEIEDEELPVESAKKTGKKVNEDLGADVKALAKDAKQAVTDGDWTKASELITKLAQIQQVTPEKEEKPKEPKAVAEPDVPSPDSAKEEAPVEDEMPTERKQVNARQAKENRKSRTGK